jgi:hypothetical protein
MERITTKTSLFGVVLAMVAMLLASLSARGQYESFFGGESWEYTNGFHPVTKSTADYDPYLLACLTNTYSFTRSDTMIIGGQTYYNGVTHGLGEYQVKLREDTLNGRLYALIEDKEFLLCDMSLSIGDTFKIPVSPLYNYMDTMRMLVDSVTFVNSKKVLHISPASEDDAFWWYPFLSLEEAYNISLRFIEGVGPMYGIVPPYQNGEVLLCLTKDDTLYYMTHPDLGCWQELDDISDYPEQAMAIYPNPAEHYISITLQSDGEVQGDIVVRDIVGRVCLLASVSKPIINLNIENLHKGTYLITYNDRKNRKITKKIVKR